MRGVYIMGDSSTGVFRGLQRDGTNWAIMPLLTTGPGIVSFGEDEAGNLYAVNPLFQGKRSLSGRRYRRGYWAPTFY